MKKIIVGVVVVIAVAVAVFYFFSNLNSLVAAVIEKQGGEATGTSVSVSGVDISLRQGRGSIQGLRVASPEEFKTRDAFSLQDIVIDIDLATVRKNPVVIDEVKIQTPVIHVEVTKTGATNIEQLRKQVQAHTAGAGRNASSNDKRIRIRKFVFEQGVVEVDATALGAGKHTITLPEIRMNDVGGANGAAPEEITKIVVTTVATRVASEVASSEVNRLIRDKLGGSLSDKAKGLLKKIGD